MNDFRTEKDSLGSIQVPKSALHGAQTQRAIENFTISGRAMPLAFIKALIQLKATAARVNGELGLIDTSIARAIGDASETLLSDDKLITHFPVDIFQTGSGTSTNMNANEVLATLASRQLGKTVRANDHVNYGQSSNDVIPTVLHISAALTLHQALLPTLAHLSETILNKAQHVTEVVKTGRTHLMDAMPIRLSQSLQGWADQIDQNHQRLSQLMPQLTQLALGGTAVGTGVNAHPEFAARFCQAFNQSQPINFRPADNYFSHIGAQDTIVSLSGQLNTLAVSLMKISNDLRWMNSGPLAGLGEIALEALQPGSSIMPGKVNPVIPEAVSMIAVQVMGNHTTITVAGQSGNFELNVMLPLMADRILDSLELLTNGSRLLADKAINSFKVNHNNLEKALARNPILATALNPIIGYEKAATIAKRAYKENRPVIDIAVEETDLSLEELKTLLDPKRLTDNGAG